jgi:hypothetical protein
VQHAETHGYRSRRDNDTPLLRPGVCSTHLLRLSYREGGTIKNETLGNLAHLPDDLIEIKLAGIACQMPPCSAQTAEVERE